MISQLTLKVQAKGVEAASKNVQTLATGVGALEKALTSLGATAPALATTAKMIGQIGRSLGKFDAASSSVLSLAVSMNSFSAAAQAAAQITGAINLKNVGGAASSINQAAQGMNALASASAAANQASPKAATITSWASSASPALGSVIEGFKGLQGGIKAAEAFMQPLTGAVGAGVAAFQQLKAAVDAGTGALMQMGQEGAKIEQLDVAFRSIAGGGNAAALKMQELRSLTGGIVDDFSLQKSFNMAKLFGIPKDTIPKLLKIAQGASIAMGTTVEKATSDVMVAVARKSRPIADNLGVVLRNLKLVYGDYAQSIGKDVEKLTEEEKQLAFAAEFVRSASDQTKLAAAAQANEYAKLSAATANMENEFKVMVSQMLAGSGALDFVTSGIKQMQDAANGSSMGVIQGAMKSLFMVGSELGKMLVPVFKAAVPVITTALDLLLIFSPVLTGALQIVGGLTTALVVAVRVALLPFVKALDLVVWTIGELADSVGIATPNLDSMRAGIDQFVSNTGEMLNAGFNPEITVAPVPIIPPTELEAFAEATKRQLSEGLAAQLTESDQKAVMSVGISPQLSDKQLLNDFNLDRNALAAMRAQAVEAIRHEMGGGILDGLAMAAGDSAAGAAQVFSAFGTDIGGASEASLLAAGQMLVETARGGKVRDAMQGAAQAFVGGFKSAMDGNLSGLRGIAESGKALSQALTGSLSGDDLVRFADIAKVEAAGGIKMFANELKQVSSTVAPFNSAISDMNKGLQEAFGEEQGKKRENFIKGMFESVNKFGLIKTDSPVQQMTANDINSLLDYQDTVTALSDSGEVLTGSQALLTNAIRANGNTASGAVDALKSYEATLIQTGDALVWMRTQAAEAGKDTSGFTALLERQAAQLVNVGKARAEAEKKAKDEKNKGGGKKDDGKQALRERAEMIGLEDFEKARLAAERTLAKDMKTAGADPALKDAARKIYADAVGKPALDELARIGGAMAGMTTQIGGMIAASGKALFSNPEVADMIKASRANLLKAGLSMQTVDLGGGRSRKRTEQEVNAQIELIALEKEWAAKKEILQEGSEAYLVVMSDYLLKKKDLEGQLKTQQEESILSALAGFEGVFGAVQGTFDSLMESGTVGEQAVASLSGTVLMLGQDMAGMADQFKGIDEAMAKGSITSGQAEVQKANAIVGAAGRAAAGVIKNERARAAVQGAVEVALAASSFAIGDIAGGIAHSAAAALFFTASGRGSGGTAAARNITPRRSAAGSDRGSSAGDRRQSTTQVNIYMNPITGRAIVDRVNQDSARQAGLAFNGRVMQGAARRPEL